MRIPIAACAAAALATACYEPPVATPQTRVTQETPIRVPQNPQNKVDILFMVDNSLSMDAMQAELRGKFGSFLSVFDDLATKGTYADLHIGVVTSDYGAGDKAVAGGCDAYGGGQHGFLQKIGAAATGCSGPSTTPFISYAYGAGGATHNLPAGQTLAQTFTCMATVGSRGCGFEHQLESVYAALTNRVENAGFLRDDALLAVVFVTNEDDGSAPATARIYEATDGGAHGFYDTYRQTRYGIACGNPLAPPPYGDSGGPLAGCVPAPDLAGEMIGEEFDVSRYVNLLTQPIKRGGIKRDPGNDVILVGLEGVLADPQIILAKSTSGVGVAPEPAYVPCAPLAEPTCLVKLQHSCQNPVAPAFFADPPIRMHAVLASAINHIEASICGDDPNQAPDFSKVLVEVADRIHGAFSPGCIPALLSSSEHPDCVVEDVTTDDSGVDHITEIPRCDLAMGAFPCWRVEDKAACKDLSPQSLGVTIDRNGVAAPLDTTLHVFCSTLAN
ncbi:MAG: hypothetical protein JWM53_1536 [bacterium]|nr:hypothetical protein [bacterium]